MNYIVEINAFYNWLSQNSLSGNAQALWHRLMAYANTFRWKTEFTIANIRLVDELGISRTEFDRIRNVLVQKNLITYKKGNGRNAGTYTIMSFVVSHNVTQDITQDVTQDITQDVTQCVTQNITQDRHSTLPLYKHKQKLNVKDTNISFIKEKANCFVAPTVDEVWEYCHERNNTIDAQCFCDYYQANGWIVGNTPMKDWRAGVRKWETNALKNNFTNNSNNTENSGTNWNLKAFTSK